MAFKKVKVHEYSYLRKNGTVVKVPTHDRKLKKEKGKIDTSKFKKGSLTKVAINNGFIKRGEMLTSLSEKEMVKFGKILAEEIGTKKAMNKCNSMVILRKNSRKPEIVEQRKKFEACKVGIKKYKK